MPHLDALLELEHAVWQALVDGAPDVDERLLSDDFVGVYPTGYADRGDHVDQLRAGPSVGEYRLSEARVVEISEDAALLTYLATYRRPERSHHEQMYVSSLWCRRGDRWVNTFSQDTPVGPPVV